MDSQKLWEQREDQLGHLPGPILRDLARNGAAPYAWRKEAVRLMLEKGYAEAGHPDLEMFVAEVRSEQEARDEVVSVVESAIEEPLPEVVNTPLVVPPLVPDPLQKSKGVKVKKQPPSAGPFAASVTTSTMFQNETVQNAEPVQEVDNDASA